MYNLMSRTSNLTQRLQYVTDIIIRMNPNGDSGGNGERESTDTADRSDCSPSEDMDL